jgi:RHS repeat-associated protein
LPAAYAGDRFKIDNVKMTVLTKPAVQFAYNDKGFRVKKESFLGAYTQTTYYVRDAAGSPMAIVSMPVGRTRNPPRIENPIYGASRLGIYKKNTNTSVYQFTDHLGNIRAVASKNPNGIVSLSGATDYFSGGMPMPNRQIVNGEPYRYAFQGQEKDPETGKEAFQLRLWDARIGRWLTTDPKGQFYSPYLGMGNNPMNGTDPDGAFFEGTEEPPVDGLGYFRDDTGEYFWNETKGSYEHYKINDDGNSFFEGYFNSTMESRPVGDYNLYFNLEEG